MKKANNTSGNNTQHFQDVNDLGPLTFWKLYPPGVSSWMFLINTSEYSQLAEFLIFLVLVTGFYTLYSIQIKTNTF